MSDGAARLASAQAEALELARVADLTPETVEGLCRRYPEARHVLERLFADFRSLAHWSRVFESSKESAGPGREGIAAQRGQVNPEGQLAKDRFQVVRTIGRGGMGTVQEAWDPELGRAVALKVQHAIGAARDPLSRMRFQRQSTRMLREARTMAGLDHPGIVAAHEIGLDEDGRAWIAMQLVDGIEFRQVVEAVHARDPRWPLRAAIQLLVKAADAVAHAHSRGVMHRDLKPSNIMVGEFSQTYVMDWGLAKSMGSYARSASREPEHDAVPEKTNEEGERPGFTLHGEVLGTPAYMAPEQADPSGAETTHAADVYGLGAILYHLLAGHPPYADQIPDPDPQRILSRLESTAPTPIGRGALGSTSLQRICSRAMARNPQSRYPSVVDLASDLRAYLSHRTVAASRPNPILTLRNWLRRHGRAVAVVAAPALALSLLGMALLGRAREARDLSRELAAKAERERTAATREASRAQARLDILIDLELASGLTELERRAAELWPADSRRLPELRAWEAEAQRLEAALPRLEKKVGGSSGKDDIPVEERVLARATERIAEFVTGSAGSTASLHVVDNDLPSVRNRIKLALATERLLASDPPFGFTWEDVEAGFVASGEADSPRHAFPRAGLVPLRPDPYTGLWEFWHVQSGARPQADATDPTRWDIRPETGLIFVLVPGGQTIIGSTPSDRAAEAHELPRQTLHLDPFYVSKYEMTQAQWTRLAGSNPSTWTTRRLDSDSGIHPVETVSWEQAARILPLFGLCLPSEAQWEYAARGGTETRWSTGDEPSDLEWAANLADLSRSSGREVEWNDGFPATSPVGRLEPNRFGLHDVHGNVREWCVDWFQLYSTAGFAKGTGVRAVPNVNGRVARGSGYRDGTTAARTARRMAWQEDHRSALLGLRPAMTLTPSND